MFRNEKELINSLFHKLNGKDVSKPAPLTTDELNEIESYRDSEGLIDLTHVKSFNKLQRLIELVDRKNHLEELNTKETGSFQNTVGDLITELLPLIGVEKANVKLNTPEGEATVEVARGEKPKVTYDVKTKDSDPTLTYTVQYTKEGDKPVDLNEVCTSYECDSCPHLTECFSEVVNAMKDCGITLENALVSNEGEKINELDKVDEPSSIAEDKPRTILVVSAGGSYNPAFENAVAHICELEHFQDADVYTAFEDLPEKIDTYVLIPNAFGKIFQAAAEEYSDILVQSNADVYMIDPETFELVRIINPFDLFDFAMTEAQEDALRY